MKNWLNSNRMIVLLIALLIGGCKTETAHEEGPGYYCPMHPTVVSQTQGVCPVCHMDLVPKSVSGEDEAADATLQVLSAPVAGSVLSGVRTLRGTWERGTEEWTTDGVVATEAGQVISVSTRTGGRIEYSALRYEGQAVRAGQELVRIHSPELSAAQQAHLQSRLPETRHRLLLLGMTETQITSMEQSGKILTPFPITAPTDGYLMAAESRTEATAGGMDDAEAVPTPSGTSLATTGMQVSAGQAIAFIRKAAGVSVRITIPATAKTFLRKGDTLRLKDWSGRSTSATVDRTIPADENGYAVIIAQTKNTSYPNGTRLKVVLNKRGPEGLWIPRSAAVYLGTQWVVFVPSENRFIPRSVIVDKIFGDRMLVTSGLVASEDIAAEARFLVDSDRNPETQQP
ncbi:MAG: efflux RND transporter periplasmic adaptor subunit [Bacteroidota bacterium]